MWEHSCPPQNISSSGGRVDKSMQITTTAETKTVNINTFNRHLQSHYTCQVGGGEISKFIKNSSYFANALKVQKKSSCRCDLNFSNRNSWKVPGNSRFGCDSFSGASRLSAGRTSPTSQHWLQVQIHFTPAII